MWASVIPAAASIGGALIQASGQSDANDTNIRLSQENRDFQERMSSTSYQRAVKDMVSAGLSPMLAYSQGGASSPSGHAAVVQNTKGHMANSAKDASMGAIQGANIAAVTEREKSQTDLNRATIDETNAKTAEILSESGAKNQEVELPEGVYGQARSVRNMLKSQELQKSIEDTGVSHGHALELQQRISSMLTTQRLTRAQILDTMKGMEKKAAEIFLREMEMPGARNRAHSDSNWWGSNIRPYLKDAGSVVNSAAGISSVFRKGRNYIFGGN